jgi:hypothetical protein
MNEQQNHILRFPNFSRDVARVYFPVQTAAYTPGPPKVFVQLQSSLFCAKTIHFNIPQRKKTIAA